MAGSVDASVVDSVGGSEVGSIVVWHRSAEKNTPARSQDFVRRGGGGGAQTGPVGWYICSNIYKYICSDFVRGGHVPPVPPSDYAHDTAMRDSIIIIPFR